MVTGLSAGKVAAARSSGRRTPAGGHQGAHPPPATGDGAPAAAPRLPAPSPGPAPAAGRRPTRLREDYPSWWTSPTRPARRAPRLLADLDAPTPTPQLLRAPPAQPAPELPRLPRAPRPSCAPWTTPRGSTAPSPALANELAEQVEEFFLLVLDDYHAVGAAPEVNSAKDWLLQRLPEGCRVILGGAHPSRPAQPGRAGPPGWTWRASAWPTCASARTRWPS